MPKLSWDSVKSSQEFRKITTSSPKLVTPYFIAFTTKNDKNKVEFGVIASRKVGCAAERNKMKRVLRAAFSSIANDLSNASVVLIARKELLNYDYKRLVKLMMGIKKMVPNI